MKYYFHPVYGVCAFDSDGSQDSLITKEMRPLTQEEVEAHLNPPKTPERSREEWKAARAKAVDSIKVTTSRGYTFDGDEISQGRMARAILALSTASPDTKVTWVMADNSRKEVTQKDLAEALALAGSEQAAIWVRE